MIWTGQEEDWPAIYEAITRIPGYRHHAVSPNMQLLTVEIDKKFHTIYPGDEIPHTQELTMGIGERFEFEKTGRIDPEPEVQSQRQPFDQEAMALAQGYARRLLLHIPEMEGVAIIPSWSVPNERIPYGVVVGRHGPLHSPPEIMHMAVQVHGCLQQQLDNAYAVLRGLDEAMSAMAKEIHDKQRQLDELSCAVGRASEQAAILGF